MDLILKIYLFPSMAYNYLLMKFKKVEYGKNLIINGTIGIYGHGKIKIGDNVTINSIMRFNPIGGIKTLFQTRHGGMILIGNNVGISHCAITAYKKVKIGDNVLIGSGVKIYDTDFHALNYDGRMGIKKGVIASKEVVINEGVFIGAHTIILKGVSIGRYSIIGAGSVVTKSVPDNEIWAGNPARYIKDVPVD